MRQNLKIMCSVSISYILGRVAAQNQLNKLRDLDMTRKQTQLLAARDTMLGLVRAFEIAFNDPNETTRKTFRNLCAEMVGSLFTDIGSYCDNGLLETVLEAFTRAFTATDLAERERFHNICGGMLNIMLTSIESACEKAFN